LRRPRQTRESLVRSIPELWALLIGTDPGLLRLRLAVRAAISLGLVVGVMHFVAPRVGIPSVVTILLGGMVAMNGSFSASSRSPRDAAVTLLFFPAAAACGVLPGSLVAGHRRAELGVFVLVMVVAVFVRRYGPRGFQYGMMAWLAYFFTMFVGFRLGQFWDVLAVIAAATACVAASAILLTPDRPQAAYSAARRAFDVRVAALAEAVSEAISGRVRPDRAVRVLHAKGFRVVEAALIVDGYLAGVAPQAPDEHSPAAVQIRRGLLDVELAAEGLATIAGRLAQQSELPAAYRVSLAAALEDVHRRDLTGAGRRAAVLAAQLEDLDDVPVEVARDLRAASRALLQLIDGLKITSDPAGARSLAVPSHVQSFTPAVNLFLGNLPATSPTAVASISDGTTWWSRRSLNTRLCIQVAVAGSIAVYAGDLLSGRRYYWAVLACFLALTGTVTTGEIAVKGANRVLGTFVGLLAATITVHFTGSNDAAIVGVVLACIFLGLYFFRVSYAVMAFAITTVMGQLYNVLHEFSDQLLLLRLAETALGAVVGIGVALVVLPVRTADVRAAGIDAFLSALRSLLEDVRERLATGAKSADLFYDARRVDGQLHQLALLALPAGGQTLIGLSGRRASQRLVPFTETAYFARSLAVSVGRFSLQADKGGCLPELATEAEAILRHLDDLHASAGVEQVISSLGPLGDEIRQLRRDVDAATKRAGWRTDIHAAQGAAGANPVGGRVAEMDRPR
jgi:hypothetical protein